MTAAGKNLFAWDQPGIKPGTRWGGAVLLNAHSWPDNSALGNWLMTRLNVGMGVILIGAHGQTECYKVTSKKIYPRDKIPYALTFGYGGPPRLSIIICSWPRLGPENWANREVWMAYPY